MSLKETTLRFGSSTRASQWFDQLRSQWVVTDTHIEEDHEFGGVLATAWFATEDGALIPAQREDDHGR